jgi:hypothetical protein
MAGQIPSRDWTRAPAIQEVTTTQDIWAVGDAHADPQRFATALVGAGLIQSVPSNPSSVKWTGEKSVLVMTGDMVDKWQNSVGIFQMMQALQASAAGPARQPIPVDESLCHQFWLRGVDEAMIDGAIAPVWPN